MGRCLSRLTDRGCGRYPHGVSAPSMSPSAKASIGQRLARIEGQVRGVSAMVEADRYCIDVLTQVRAARAALAKVEQAILSDHLGHCVEAAIVSGDPEAQRAKVAELIEVLSRATF
jgi:DNA-binding FrmR family transcriptional regulator